MVAWRALGVSVVAVLVAACARRGSQTGECSDDDGGVRRVVFLARTYDVDITAAGTYAVAQARDVIEFDACTLARIGGCSSAHDVIRVRARREGRVVDLLRGDGSVSACDLQRSLEVVPSSDARDALTRPREARADGDALWIDGVHALLQPRGERPRALDTRDEALDVVLDPQHRLAIVSDRSGAVSLFALPGGLLVDRYVAHARNAYAVRLDTARRRIVSVAGPGGLDVRPLPEHALAWARTLTPRSP